MIYEEKHHEKTVKKRQEKNVNKGDCSNYPPQRSFYAEAKRSRDIKVDYE